MPSRERMACDPALCLRVVTCTPGAKHVDAHHNSRPARYGKKGRRQAMFVFFDIGDTLVDESDFARFRHASIYEFFGRRGCELTEDRYTADLMNLSMQARMTFFEQLRWLAERNGGDTLRAPPHFRDYMLQVAPEAQLRFQPFADAVPTLRTLSARTQAEGTEAARHLYRLGIIANQPTWIRASMRDWGLLDYFEPDCAVISDEVGMSKPHPEIFQFALAQAGVEPEDAVMVGNDYTHDIEPAKRLGMSTIWVEREDPYAPGAPPVLDPIAADERVTQLAEVPAALKRIARAAALAHADGRRQAGAPPRRRSSRLRTP